MVMTGLVFAVKKVTAQIGPGPYHPEQICRNCNAGHPLRVTAAGEVIILFVHEQSRHLFEAMTTLLKISKVRLRKRRVKDSPAREALPYHHKSIRIVVRQGLQQDGVDYAKDSSVGSNPER